MYLLQSVRELKRYTLFAVDGEIGSIEELYFDDATWTVRYLVVKTAGWLKGRRVLISPVAVGEVREDDKVICIELTRGQIGNSPPVGTERPVSRQYEVEYYKYYNWPPYWELGPLSGFSPPRTPASPPPAPVESAQTSAGQMHLRSTAEVKGYDAAARDGDIGHVEDFIIDTQYCAIRYLEIDTRNWWPDRHVLVNPGWIEHVNWAERTVYIDLTRGAIKSAPPFDPLKIISRDYEARLFKHYGRRAYWKYK